MLASKFTICVKKKWIESDIKVRTPLSNFALTADILF